MMEPIAASRPARALIAMTPAQRAALPRRTAFTFTGRPCVDLAMTGGEGWMSVFEVLHAPDDLDRWLAEGALAVAGTSSNRADLRTARALRTAVTAALDAILGDRLPPVEAIAAINAAAAAPSLAPQIDPASGALGWAAPTTRAVLSELARDALALIGDREQWKRLRVCASDDCGIVFFDASRPGRRRWCSTERCGDRNRARAYRARKRGGGS